MQIKLDKDTSHLLKVMSVSKGKSINILIAEIIDKAGKEHLRNLLISKFKV